MQKRTVVRLRMKSIADLTDPNIRDQGLQQVWETDVFALLLNTSIPFSYQLSATQVINDTIFFFLYVVYSAGGLSSKSGLWCC